MTIFLIVIAIILLVIFVWYIVTSNTLNKTIVKIEEADSSIDIALTKRYDVLTKAMDVVKAYAKHEKETLFEVIQLRKGMSIEEKSEVNHKMDNNFDKISILSESYPELRSNETYVMLQKSIIDIEENLQASRRMYNANVSIFNQLLVTFPTSIVANNKKLSSKQFFEADSVKKEDVKIEL